MTPQERIACLRREHTRIEHPVACCRMDHQNWPCSVISALDAATAAERKRILEAAEAAVTTFLRPGLGPAHGERLDVVKLDDLRKLLEGP